MFGKSQPRATINAARIIGPLFVAGGALLITRHERLLGVIQGFLDDGAVVLLAAFAALAVGLVILVLHPHWRGVTQCLVSAIGIISVLRGLVLMFAPELVQRAALVLFATPQILPVLGCAVALLGLWFVVFSFITPPEDGLGYFSS